MESRQFTFIKPFEYSRIAPDLLAGRNPLTAADVTQLAAEGVTHILDLREPFEWLPPRLGLEALTEIERRGLTRCSIPITDGGAPGGEDFDRCVAFLTATFSNTQAQVYVHCRAGMERTAAILIAWYARQECVSYEMALQKLQMQRPILAPLPEQEQATRRWLKCHHATNR